MKPLSMLLLVFFVLPAEGQTVVLTRIVNLTTPVHGAGNRPALDDGMVAFLGEDTATGIWGIYMTAADGSGPLTLIADENTPIPNVPGETFLELDNPEIHDGVVVFTGGFELLFVDKQGIYMGNGGPLAVYYDSVAASFNPQPFAPVVDGSDLVFHSIGSNSSDQNTAPYYMPAVDEAVFISGPLPGGGDGAFLNSIGDNPSLGGGHVVLSTRVVHDSTIDGAVYTWSVEGQSFNLVANWNTQIPGHELFFDHFGTVDTDGSNVVFRGQQGFIGFGGHQGLYLAPAGGGGAGPFTTIAEIGQIAPGTTDETFASFGDVAIDGNLVIFEASLGSANSPSRQGIYGCRNGELFRVIDSEDIVDGQEILGAEMNLRGLDRNQLVMRITFVNQQHPNLSIDFGVYVASLGFAPGDVNQDGNVNLLDVDPFIDLIGNGEYQVEADINQDGAVNLLDVQPFINLLSG